MWADCDALYMNLDTPVHELLAVGRHSLHGGQGECMKPPHTRGSVTLTLSHTGARAKAWWCHLTHAEASLSVKAALIDTTMCIAYLRSHNLCLRCHVGALGRCKLKPVQPVLKAPSFSSSNLNERRLLSGGAFNSILHRPTMRIACL